MNKTYGKKLIGTGVFALLVVGVFAAAASFVQAKFVENPGTLVFDGLVSDSPIPIENGKKFELVLLTSGTEPVSVLTNKKTRFTGGISGADDVVPGDHLKIEAKVNDGVNTAKVVKLVESDASGYGTAGDKVFVARATVLSKTSNPNTFTVESAAATVTFRVNSSTKFLFTTFDKLSDGDKVMVQGRDSGSEFVAKLVVKLNKNKGGWGHGDYDHDDRWWDDRSGWHGENGSHDRHDDDEDDRHDDDDGKRR